MRLSWNEIRARAATFAREWDGAGYEKGQTQLFYRDFFDVFGMPVRRVAAFEEPVKLLGDRRGFIDLFWKGVLLVEQKSAGHDLTKAKTQALSYFPGLKDADLPRYILLSDFATFELYDLDEDESVAFALADLPNHVEKFGFILGVQRRTFRDQDPVNIKASERVGDLHDALAASGYTGHDLEQFLVRIVFCFFADDTGIFEPRDIFLDLLENRTWEDGSDLGGWLAQLFQVLNTPEDRRSKTLDEDLARFPYVNGDLFRDPLLIPSFDSAMRQRLIDAGTELKASKPIIERLERVRSGRLQSPTESVREYAQYPTLFTQDRQPDTDYLAIPEVSSETREYIPIDMLPPTVIASNKLQIIPSAPLYYFGILTSAMHMAWMRTVAGRLKSDYSYAPTVYNSFPWPEMTATQRKQIERLSQVILDARALFSDSSLDVLYNTDAMPPDLRKAHQALDRAVDRLYRRSGFTTERERVEHLFGLYEKMLVPLTAKTKPKRRRRRA